MATDKKVSSATAHKAVAAEELLAPAAPEGLLTPAVPETEPVAALSAFPVQVMLRNNGGFSVSEPVSGAFLPAGGSQVVTLHDEAHASRVLDNLRELAHLNHLGDALVVEALPVPNQE